MCHFINITMWSSASILKLHCNNVSLFTVGPQLLHRRYFVISLLFRSKGELSIVSNGEI